MFRASRIAARGLVIALLLASAESRRVSAADLDTKQIESLHALIKPTKAESRFLEIPWITNLQAARQKAAKEGKPLMIFLIHGHLLGGC